MSSVPGSPYDALSFREIQAECKRRGLKALAKRDELSRSLEEFDKSPANTPSKSATTPSKNRPRPAIITSTLRTSTYPPPTPPFSDAEDSSDSASEPPSPQQQSSSPAKQTTKHSRADVPSPITRYPVPATHYVPTDHPETDEKVPGWMLQAAFAMCFLALVLMVTYGGRSDYPFRERYSLETIRHALSDHPAGERIAQALSMHQRIVLVGPVEKGRDVAKKIASLLAPHNATTALVLKEPNSALLVEKIANKLRKDPESVIVINTDVIDRDNSHFLNMLLDDSLPTLVNHKDVRINRAVFILLADLAQGMPEKEITHEFVERALRKRWDDRVAERVHPLVVL